MRRMSAPRRSQVARASSRVVVADAPGAQLLHGNRSSLVLDQELEATDQDERGHDREREPHLGHAARVNRGQLAVAGQLGEREQSGKQSRHRDELGQDVRQPQDHVERERLHGIIVRGDHLIAVAEELDEQHQRRQTQQHQSKAAEQKTIDVAGDDRHHVTAPPAGRGARPKIVVIGRWMRSVCSSSQPVPTRSSAKGSQSPS